MNRSQRRRYLNLEIQTRINNAQCKAMSNNSLIANLFTHEIQQKHFEIIQNKLTMASAMKMLSKAHNNALLDILEQYKKAIKSGSKHLETFNKRMDKLMDKERDLLEAKEDTVLSIRDAIESEFDSIIQDTIEQELPQENEIVPCLPKVPEHDPSEDQEKAKKKIHFGNVIIKSVDEAEDEKQRKRCEDSDDNYDNDANCFYTHENLEQKDLNLERNGLEVKTIDENSNLTHSISDSKDDIVTSII